MENNCSVCGLKYKTKGNSKYCTICRDLIDELFKRFITSIAPISREMVVGYAKRQNGELSQIFKEED